MAKYRVYGTIGIGVWVDVEAENENEAQKEADEKWEGLTGFCGNGGSDKLVGVYGSDHGVYPNDDSPEWQDVEES